MRLLLLLLIIVGNSQAFAQEGILPSVDVKTLDGKTINTASINNDGKPIILCIWEVTCKPCIQEFDNLSQTYEAWQKETGVKIVAISIDDNRSYHKVAPLVRSKDWPFEFYQDKNQDIKRALGVPNCPFTMIIDGKGNVISRKTGYVPGDEVAMYETIKATVKTD